MAASTGARRRAEVLGWLTLLAALTLGLLAWRVAAGVDGVERARSDLLQYYTRDNLSEYGSHWRFHWLSTLWFAAGAPVAARMALGASGTRGRAGRSAWIVAWAYFWVMTAVFGMSRQIFLDIRYVGHQAREMLTHGSVTMLLLLGGLSVAARYISPAQTPRDLAGLASRSAEIKQKSKSGQTVVLGQWVLVLAIPSYLAVIALLGDVMAAGQSESGLAAMIGAHYFEHTLDYALTVLLGLAGLAFLLLVPDSTP